MANIWERLSSMCATTGENVNEKKNDKISSASDAKNDVQAAVADQISDGNKNENKHESRAAEQFVIPKRNICHSALLVPVKEETREFQNDILPYILQSYRKDQSKSSFKYSHPYLVQNIKLEQEFLDKKKECRQACYSDKELKESYGFLFVDKEQDAERLCREGVMVSNLRSSCLGHSEMGVQLCKHADVIRPFKMNSKYNGYLVMFKIIKGKVKVVLENSSSIPLEPTPNFDCHVAVNTDQKYTCSAVDMVDLFKASQIYIYEYGEESILERPRQVLPFAVVQVSYMPKPTCTENPNSNSRAITKPVLTSPKQKTSQLMKEEEEYIVWNGQLTIKGLYACYVSMKSAASCFKPAKLGKGINISHKIDATKVKQKYLRNVGKLQKKNEELCGHYYVNVCELHPSKPEGKSHFEKVMNYFGKHNYVAVQKLEKDIILLLLTQSELSYQLGLSRPHQYPTVLYCLFLSKYSRRRSSGGDAKHDNDLKKDDQNEASAVAKKEKEDSGNVLSPSVKSEGQIVNNSPQDHLNSTVIITVDTGTGIVSQEDSSAVCDMELCETEDSKIAVSPPIIHSSRIRHGMSSISLPNPCILGGLPTPAFQPCMEINPSWPCIGSSPSQSSQERSSSQSCQERSSSQSCQERSSSRPCQERSSSQSCQERSPQPCQERSSQPCQERSSSRPCQERSSLPCQERSSQPCQKRISQPCQERSSSQPCQESSSSQPCQERSSHQLIGSSLPKQSCQPCISNLPKQPTEPWVGKPLFEFPTSSAASVCMGQNILSPKLDRISPKINPEILTLPPDFLYKSKTVTKDNYLVERDMETMSRLTESYHEAMKASPEKQHKTGVSPGTPTLDEKGVMQYYTSSFKAEQLRKTVLSTYVQYESTGQNHSFEDCGSRVEDIPLPSDSTEMERSHEKSISPPKLTHHDSISNNQMNSTSQQLSALTIEPRPETPPPPTLTPPPQLLLPLVPLATQDRPVQFGSIPNQLPLKPLKQQLPSKIVTTSHQHVSLGQNEALQNILSMNSLKHTQDSGKSNIHKDRNHSESLTLSSLSVTSTSSALTSSSRTVSSTHSKSFVTSTSPAVTSIHLMSAMASQSDTSINLTSAVTSSSSSRGVSSNHSKSSVTSPPHAVTSIHSKSAMTLPQSATSNHSLSAVTSSSQTVSSTHSKSSVTSSPHAVTSIHLMSAVTSSPQLITSTYMISQLSVNHTRPQSSAVTSSLSNYSKSSAPASSSLQTATSTHVTPTQSFTLSHSEPSTVSSSLTITSICSNLAVTSSPQTLTQTSAVTSSSMAVTPTSTKLTVTPSSQTVTSTHISSSQGVTTAHSKSSVAASSLTVTSTHIKPAVIQTQTFTSVHSKLSDVTSPQTVNSTNSKTSVVTSQSVTPTHSKSSSVKSSPQTISSTHVTSSPQTSTATATTGQGTVCSQRSRKSSADKTSSDTSPSNLTSATVIEQLHPLADAPLVFKSTATSPNFQHSTSNVQTSLRLPSVYQIAYQAALSKQNVRRPEPILPDPVNSPYVPWSSPPRSPYQMYDNHYNRMSSPFSPYGEYRSRLGLVRPPRMPLFSWDQPVHRPIPLVQYGRPPFLGIPPTYVQPLLQSWPQGLQTVPLIPNYNTNIPHFVVNPAPTFNMDLNQQLDQVTCDMKPAVSTIISPTRPVVPNGMKPTVSSVVSPTRPAVPSNMKSPAISAIISPTRPAVQSEMKPAVSTVVSPTLPTKPMEIKPTVSSIQQAAPSKMKSPPISSIIWHTQPIIPNEMKPVVSPTNVAVVTKQSPKPLVPYSDVPDDVPTVKPLVPYSDINEDTIPYENFATEPMESIDNKTSKEEEPSLSGQNDVHLSNEDTKSLGIDSGQTADCKTSIEVELSVLKENLFRELWKDNNLNGSLTGHVEDNIPSQEVKTSPSEENNVHLTDIKDLAEDTNLYGCETEEAGNDKKLLELEPSLYEEICIAEPLLDIIPTESVTINNQDDLDNRKSEGDSYHKKSGHDNGHTKSDVIPREVIDVDKFVEGFMAKPPKSSIIQMDKIKNDFKIQEKAHEIHQILWTSPKVKVQTATRIDSLNIGFEEEVDVKTEPEDNSIENIIQFLEIDEKLHQKKNEAGKAKDHTCKRTGDKKITDENKNEVKQTSHSGVNKSPNKIRKKTSDVKMKHTPKKEIKLQQDVMTPNKLSKKNSSMDCSKEMENMKYLLNETLDRASLRNVFVPSNSGNKSKSHSVKSTTVSTCNEKSDSKHKKGSLKHARNESPEESIACKKIKLEVSDKINPVKLVQKEEKDLIGSDGSDVEYVSTAPPSVIDLTSPVIDLTETPSPIRIVKTVSGYKVEKCQKRSSGDKFVLDARSETSDESKVENAISNKILGTTSSNDFKDQLTLESAIKDDSKPISVSNENNLLKPQSTAIQKISESKSNKNSNKRSESKEKPASRFGDSTKPVGKTTSGTKDVVKSNDNKSNEIQEKSDLECKENSESTEKQDDLSKCFEGEYRKVKEKQKIDIKLKISDKTKSSSDEKSKNLDKNVSNKTDSNKNVSSKPDKDENNERSISLEKSKSSEVKNKNRRSSESVESSKSQETDKKKDDKHSRKDKNRREDGKSSKRDEKRSRKDEKYSVKDEKHSRKDEKSSGKDEKSSRKDKHSSERDKKSSDRDKKSSERDKKSSDRDKKSSERDKKSSERDKKSSERDKKSSKRDEKYSRKDEKCSDKKQSNNDEKNKNQEDESSKKTRWEMVMKSLDMDSSNRINRSGKRKDSESDSDARSRTSSPPVMYVSAKKSKIKRSSPSKKAASPIKKSSSSSKWKAKPTSSPGKQISVYDCGIQHKELGSFKIPKVSAKSKDEKKSSSRRHEQYNSSKSRDSDRERSCDSQKSSKDREKDDFRDDKRKNFEKRSFPKSNKTADVMSFIQSSLSKSRKEPDSSEFTSLHIPPDSQTDSSSEMAVDPNDHAQDLLVMSGEVPLEIIDEVGPDNDSTKDSSMLNVSDDYAKDLNCAIPVYGSRTKHLSGDVKISKSKSSPILNMSEIIEESSQDGSKKSKDLSTIDNFDISEKDVNDNVVTNTPGAQSSSNNSSHVTNAPKPIVIVDPLEFEEPFIPSVHRDVQEVEQGRQMRISVKNDCPLNRPIFGYSQVELIRSCIHGKSENIPPLTFEESVMTKSVMLTLHKLNIALNVQRHVDKTEMSSETVKNQEEVIPGLGDLHLIDQGNKSEKMEEKGVVSVDGTVSDNKGVPEQTKAEGARPEDSVKKVEISPIRGPEVKEKTEKEQSKENSNKGPIRSGTTKSHRQDRKQHPYTRKEKRYKSGWSFDIEYNMNEIMQNLSMCLFNQRQKPATPKTSRPRFSNYRFRRSSVPEFLPDEREDIDLTRDAIPDFDERKKKAELLDTLTSAHGEDEPFTAEQTVYDKDAEPTKDDSKKKKESDQQQSPTDNRESRQQSPVDNRETRQQPPIDNRETRQVVVVDRENVEQDWEIRVQDFIGKCNTKTSKRKPGKRGGRGRRFRRRNRFSDN